MKYFLANHVMRMGAVMLVAIPWRFRTKSRGWSWKVPDLPVWLARAVARQDVLYEGIASAKDIYLTFDCGIEHGYTPNVIDTLSDEEVRAAFFITGAYLDDNVEIVRRMLADGHIVGNHTNTHPYLPQLSVNRIRTEICDLERSFENLCGRKMIYFRPPYGEFCQRSLAVAAALGYQTVFWTGTYRDWDPRWRRGEDFAYAEIMMNVRPGVIMMLHTVLKDNAEALGQVIRDLRAQGYVFRSLNELGSEQSGKVVDGKPSAYPAV
jgi:peptidoglycan-N-acetylmuramic acid deacetylase